MCRKISDKKGYNNSGIFQCTYLSSYNDGKYMHRNIPELLVFFVWYFPTLRCYFFYYCSYYIYSNDQDNFAYWKESERIEVLVNNFGLCQIQLGILVLVATSKIFDNFSPLLNLKRAFPVLKLAENCYLNMNIFFLEKWQFNNKLGPLSLLQA